MKKKELDASYIKALTQAEVASIEHARSYFNKKKDALIGKRILVWDDAEYVWKAGIVDKITGPYLTFRIDGSTESISKGKRFIKFQIIQSKQHNIWQKLVERGKKTE